MMMQASGAFGEKTMYGKKIQGTIRSTVIVGPDGMVVKHWPKVKNAEMHPAEVLEFLVELRKYRPDRPNRFSRQIDGPDLY